MTKPLWPSVVRILRIAEQQTVFPIGVGFLVSERHVLTCSHVVADALNIARDSIDQPEAEIQLDFPFIAAGAHLGARVRHWDHQMDIAILELVAATPGDSRPIHLAYTDEIGDHGFWAYGVPEHYDDGDWVQGIILGPTAMGHFQIESRSGYRPELGYSGGPVWDNQLRAVVGMIVAVDEGRPEARAGRMIHSAILVRLLDALEIQRPALVQRPAPFRYAGFISYPSEPGRQGDCIREFAEEFYQALSHELSGLLEQPIYFNREHVDVNPELARALCESMCMILVLTPRYFNPNSPLCASEFKAMQELERRRLQALEAHDDLSLIIPIFPYSRNILPIGVVGARRDFGFENRTPGNLREHPEYGPRIRRIAEYIYECYLALEACEEDFCGECGEFNLPGSHEIQDLFQGLPPRRVHRFPTR